MLLFLEMQMQCLSPILYIVSYSLEGKGICFENFHFCKLGRKLTQKDQQQNLAGPLHLTLDFNER